MHGANNGLKIAIELCGELSLPQCSKYECSFVFLELLVFPVKPLCFHDLPFHSEALKGSRQLREAQPPWLGKKNGSRIR
ncbi:hypothetical protein L1987_75030 [Smallanthus sonchifolius]|uniref:Uncharacterized protein n=1 Tax=Smallanthus sonchifolius TaxID=185202 RepID=A0ACB9A5J7_9ASTR|nr:hypothetical protein L1987_75030 [Smallanthus sonchifolius]